MERLVSYAPCPHHNHHNHDDHHDTSSPCRLTDSGRCLLRSSTECWTLPVCYRDRYAQCILCRRAESPQRSCWTWLLPCPLLRTIGTDGSRQCRKRSGSAASAVLVVLHVAVNMRRQVPVLPRGVSDQSIDNVVDCVCGFSGFSRIFRTLPKEARAHFSAPSTHSCECWRACGVPESR